MSRVAWYVDVKNKAAQPTIQVPCDFYCVYSDEDDHRLSSYVSVKALRTCMYLGVIKVQRSHN